MHRDVFQLQWGWITPGTGESNRHEQSDRHFEFLSGPVTPYRRHFLLTHCGWWLDRRARRGVRDLTGRNPEPDRALTPCGPEVVRELRRHARAGRLDFAVYPYAACVAEATTGEGLLRSLRLSRDIARGVFGKPSRAVLNHDFTYGLDWGAAQMPRIARLLGFDLILAMEDGIAVGPEGTRVRVLGRPVMRELMRLGFAGRAPIFHPLELTQNIHWHENLGKLRAEFPALGDVELRSITLGEYLRRAPAKRLFDSRVMGAKGWYGGTIDSLAQEQNAKSVELRLPAIEALAVLARRAGPPVREEIEDLWKKSFILMDNHTLWQCHDYKAHYLPESAKALGEALALERGLLAGVGRPGARGPLCCAAGVGSTVAFFNPVPWAREVVVETGGRTLAAGRVAGWGVAVREAAECAVAPRADDDPFTLDNGRAVFRLNRRGEVVEIGRGGRRQRFKGLGRLMRIHEAGGAERHALRAGQRFRIEGALSASTEIDLRGEMVEKISFEMAGLGGAAFVLQSERLDAAGRTRGVEWVPLQSLHWSGKGLPQHRMDLGPRELKATGAVRVRVTLWMLAEGGVRLGRARVWIGDERFIDVDRWAARVHYRNAYALPRGVRARVVRSDAAMKTVRFSGALPDLRYEMDISLRRGSESIEYALRLDFPRPTPLGLTSPPFTREDGSMLGAQCERPYVPGLAVLLPLPGAAEYFSDKPYYIQRAFQSSPRTWHTDRQDWWLGLSAFIGMNMASAQWRGGQLGLFTRGIKHFFRWKRGGAESLGLSLGASLIHQKTQGHSVPKESALYELLKRTDHNPYHATPFLYAHGRYEFHYALSVAPRGAAARTALWKRAQEFALPASFVESGAPCGEACGVEAEPGCVIPTAVETRGKGVTLRAVNLSGRRVEARIRVLGRATRFEMPPHGIVERAVRRLR
jgi:hypothetical protein